LTGSRSDRCLLFVESACALGASVAWWPVLSVGYLGDDFEVRRSIVMRGPLGMWAGDATGMFRPLASLSAWFDELVFPGDPLWAHLHSLLLYAACVVATAVLARQLGLRGLMSAAIFAPLCVHVEAVAWLAARADLLSTLFSTLSLAALLSWRRHSLGLAGVLLVLALLSKESAVATPVVGVLLLAALGRSVRRAALLLALLPLWFSLRAHVIGALVGGYGADALPGTSLSSLSNLAHLIQAAFLGHSTASAHAIAASTAALAAIITFLLPQPRGRRWLWLCVGFLVACVPVSGLGLPLSTGEGGRVLLFPSVLISLCAAAAVAELPPLARGAGLAVWCAWQATLTVAALRPFVDGADVVRRLLPSLGAVEVSPPPALVVPGWYGPVCVLCTGWDAAASLDSPTRHPMRIPAILYRTNSADCSPTVTQQDQGLSLELRSCAQWEAPWGEVWESGGIQFSIITPQLARVTSDNWFSAYVTNPGLGLTRIDGPPRSRWPHR
jgi:hypothetical protein